MVKQKLAGSVLLALAALVFLVPWPHHVLTWTGTSNGQTVDSAAYARSFKITTAQVPSIQRGDPVLTAIVRSNQAAAHNGLAANRRLLCLVLGLPGAYLLGRGRRGSAAAHSGPGTS
ncbi:MAG: hypothetical protein JWP11_853 [Frankiales bacterium]|nr:hypothetical protein [Frankiales bacterium]